MPVEVILPKLSTTMDEGTIVQWLKKEGDAVQAGETLFELQTDKAVMEVEAPASGTLARILFPAGSTVPIAQVVAFIAAPGEEWSEAAVQPTAPRPAQAVQEATSAVEKKARVSPYARKLAEEHGIDLATVSGSGPGGRIVERDVQAAIGRASQRPAEAEQRISISPAARKLAQELNVDLSTVTGTGPGGRIVLEDVQRAAAPPPTQPAEPTAAPGEEQVVPLTGVRRVVATRMAESARTVARVTLTSEVDATRLVEWRTRMKEQSVDPLPSYTDMIVFLLARALGEYRYMNARLENDAIHLLEPINIGVAVDTERGLLVPVLRDADKKTLAEIVHQARQLIERARAGKATPDDLSGGTFTVTNLGMYDIDAFTPIINLPECAILGIGRIVAKAVVDQGQMLVRQMMYLSLAFDHRIVDGAPAARFLQRVKQLIEEPLIAYR